MIKLTSLILVTLLITGNVKGQAKLTDNISILLCRKWNLKSYTINGKPIPLSSNQLKTYMLFQKDSTYETLNNGNIEKGKWYYLSGSKEIRINDLKGDDNAELILIVEKINNEKCTLLMKEENRDNIKIILEAKN